MIQSEALRPEDHLLLLCARVKWDDAIAHRACEILRDEIDWSYLLKSASWHGLRPLLYRHLSSQKDMAVPPTVLEELRQAFETNAKHNLFLAAQLLNLNRAFTESGIPFFVFKGLAIATDIYGDITLREFCDLDIMIRREDYTRSAAALSALSFRQLEQLTPALENFRLQIGSECMFVHRQHGGIVDLHWGFAPRNTPGTLDSGETWSRLASFAIAGTQLKTPGIEDTILLLTTHGAKHLWARLEWLCGIAELLRRHHAHINWDEVVRLAESAGCRRQLLVGAGLAQTLLDAPLPKEMKQGIEADKASVQLIVERAARMFTHSFMLPDKRAKVLWSIKIADRTREGLETELRKIAIPQSSDWNAYELPSAFTRLYYPLRLLRLMAKYVKQLVSRP